MPGDENKNIPVNPYIIYHMELIPQTKEYWETKNPIIPRMKAALDTDSNTYRVGDGETHYLDLEPRPYIAGGGGWEFELATETEPGAVSNLASDSDVDSATGPGVVQAKHLAIVYDKVKGWMISDKQIAANVGDRFLKPWKYPKPGYKVLNGQYIETSDVSYGILKQYLALNPDEVITSIEYETKLAAAGGVGGVHFYALYSDGRIRLPDVRGDYWEGSGFDGREVLEWRTDAIREIEGSISPIEYHTNASTAVATGAFKKGAINTNGWGTATGVNAVTMVFKASNAVPTANVNRPRGAGYLPVVYAGVGQEWISENGQIFLADVRGKSIGEIFMYDGITDPPGGFELNGRLLSRTAYGTLFQHVVSNNKIKTEAEWQQTYQSFGGNVDFYSYSNDPDMFRIPTYNKNDRNWLTESLLCVQGYHAVIDTGSISYPQLVEEVYNRIGYPKVGESGGVLCLNNTGTPVIDMMFQTSFICESTAEVTLAKTGLTPNYADMFNNWKKYSMLNAVQPGIPEELTAWSYNSTTDAFQNTTNSSSHIGCVSPEKYEDYVFEVTLKSTSTDDDSIGIVLAFTEDTNSWENALCAWRSPGGQLPLWSIMHNRQVKNRDAATLTNAQTLFDGTTKVKWGNGQYGVNVSQSGYTVNGPNGWSSLPLGVKIKATRTKNIIKIETTDFLNFGNANYLTSTIATIDLTSSTTLRKYNKPCSIGFCALSQQASSWSNISIQSPQKVVYDFSVNPAIIHEYNDSSKLWTTRPMGSIENVLSVGRMYVNTVTNKTYIVFPDGIRKIAG